MTTPPSRPTWLTCRLLSLTPAQASTLADLQIQMADYQTLVDPIRTLSRAGNETEAASKIMAAAANEGR